MHATLLMALQTLSRCRLKDMTSHGSQGPCQRLLSIDMLPQDSVVLKDITHISSPLLDLKFTITMTHKIKKPVIPLCQKRF